MRSIHLTFAIRERTPVWVAEKLVGCVIEKDAFRRVIPPADIEGQRLSQHVRDVRQALLEHLAGLDVDDFGNPCTEPPAQRRSTPPDHVHQGR
ncbi:MULTISPECIES: hypothetical protein [unclassified Streptomyces]|uniref:hypothetical protein n=1 Tax=unclassified Streptomyces TaxID=2593676 RepID=UPI0027E54F6A|nr:MULTISPECIES: hypothetical protein [unclassified Streptomyces]